MVSLREVARKDGMVAPPISLRALLAKHGVTSLLAVAASQDIDEFYRNAIGQTVVGSPVGAAGLSPRGGYQKPYTFGTILKPSDADAKISMRYYVSVQIAAVRCFGTEDPGGEDEPYFVISLFAVDKVDGEKAVETIRIGPDGIAPIRKGDVFLQGR